MSGEVENLPGWDDVHSIAVVHWSRHRDSGCLLGSFHDRRAAVSFARAYASEHGYDLWNADIVEFARVVK